MSGSKSVDTLVPASMADSSRNAMERVEQKKGNVDDFVQDALGYEADADGMYFIQTNPETGERVKARPFSAEQIDAIALAIDNVERGDAMILGDACVAGHTRIYDPISSTHTTIRELAERRSPIKVLALTPNGFQTVSATTPFYKGVADLYRVELDDGRAITVTRQHRFLTPDGWRTLDDGLREGHFLASAEDLLANSSACSPSTRHAGGPRWTGIAPGSSDRCSAYPYPCGAPLHSDRDDDLELAPSPADVLARTHYCLRAGEMVLSLGHSRQHQDSDHPSRNSSSPSESRALSRIASQGDASLASVLPTTLGSAQPSRYAQVEPRQEGGAALLDLSRVYACGSSLNEFASARHSSGDGMPPSEGESRISRRSVPCSSLTHSQHESNLFCLSFGDHTGWRCVKSITFVGRDEFFDMWVPGFENYVAEGIVNHNTGIGKGRVGAGMLRYAIRKGLIPVLMTEKMDLYGDMYRDMRDIGMFEMLGREPRILTTDVGKSIPLDEEAVSWKADAELAEEAGDPLPPRRGKFLAGGTSEKKDNAYDRLLAGDASVADVVFTTYSQMQTLGEGKAIPRRRSVLNAIAPRAMMVLDETHNAGGQGVVDDTRGKKSAEGGRAEFVRELTSKAKGLLFMSATYAKRPNVMDLYARTDMGKAVEDIKDLPKLIQRGGVPMQQIVASMLSESGQYLRRERSFEGIEYAFDEAAVDDVAYDQFVGSVQSIFKFDLDVKEKRDEIIEEILAELGAGTKGQDGGIGEASARSTGFASIMHNIVTQMLLAIKANAAADRAIEALKAGEKPIITVANTNESFISDFAEADGVAIGGTLDIDFGDMLKRYLQRTLRVTYKKAGDKKPSHYQIPLERLPISIQNAYKQIESMIDQGNYAGMPVSPIDWIRHRITQEGYTVREVTGRQTMIDYSRNRLVARPKGERGSGGKRVTISKFNGGTLDVVILNQSGSTGVSMHASEKFRDQRKRRMILAQAEANIDTHMQMLGRPNRTGQVVVPAYSQLAAAIPAEVRPMIVLMRKMASLSANTTGARGSAFSSDSADFMNEVGDKVMAEYLWENPEINVALGEPYDGADVKDVVQKATGKLVLLTVAQQREMLETVQKNYVRELEQLIALGENPLEAEMLDLQAETLEAIELKPKTGDSPFLDAVRMEKVSVKAQGRAMPVSEVADKIADALKTTKPEGSDQSAIDQLARKGHDWLTGESRRIQDLARRQMTEELATTKPDSREGVRSRALATLSRWQQTMNVAYPGSRVRLGMPSGDLDGIVMSVERSGKAKGITALSAWTVKIAVPDSARQFEFPMSKLFPSGIAKSEDEKGATLTRSGTPTAMLIQAFEDARKEGRETRYMMTGNVLGGYDQTRGQGRIVNYTTKDGQVRPGVLMSRDFKSDEFMESRAIRFQTGAQVATFVDKVSDVEVSGRDGELVLGRNRNGYYVQMAKARGKAGKYYTDKAVRGAIAPTEFAVRGNKMMAEDLSRAKFVAVIDEMKKIGAAFETTTAQDEAQSIIADSQPAASLGATDPAIRALKRGRTVNVPDAIRQNIHDSLAEHLGIVPDGVNIGALKKVQPVGEAYINDNFDEDMDILLTLERSDGSEFTAPFTLSSLDAMSAFRVGSGFTSDGRPSVVFLDRGPVQRSPETLAGKLWHETLHELRSSGRLSGLAWDRLLAHAKSINPLRTELATHLRMTGDPAWRDAGEGTLEEGYTALYRDRSDFAEIMDQETVAHFIELAANNQLLAMEVDPVRDILQDIWTGKVAGKVVRETAVRELAEIDASIGQSMRRDLDALGYYSKALEAARGLKQAKGTPEQMLAQLKSAGVKEAEIEATNLRTFLDGKKSVTRDEIVSHLEGNRVGLTERARVTDRELAAQRGRDYDRMRPDERDMLGMSTDIVKWRNYSLDPKNPTYRETVLHLPEGKPDFAKFRAESLANGVPEAEIERNYQRLVSDPARMDREDSQNFRSGHFPEPNIVGHMMTSMTTHQGRLVFTVDQIQSDWGQKLRDGGVRDEKKIEELDRRRAELTSQYEAIPANEKFVPHTYEPMEQQPFYLDAPEGMQTNVKMTERAEALLRERNLVRAELDTAKAGVTGNPLVNTTDQWVNTTLRRAIRQAAEADAEFVAIPSGDTVLSYNPGDTDGMRGFYDKIVPKNLRNLLQKIDKASPAPTRIETLDSPSGKTGLGKGFTLFPLTETVKRSVVEEGQPLFSSVSGKGETAAKDIEKAINDAVAIVSRIAGTGVQVQTATRIPFWQFTLSDEQIEARARSRGPRDPGGVYQQIGDGRALITLAYADPAYDIRTTAGHEAYHHVEEALASPAEMKLLRSPSEMERATRHAAAEIGQSIEETSKLPDYEIRAIAFQRYRRTREEGATMTPLHIGIRRMWDRLVRIFQAVRNALRGQGFDSMEAIFERARTGEMAGRSVVEPDDDPTSPTSYPITKASFAGERARTADLDALSKAKQMDSEGRDRTAIWNDTGWFKGVDGKWRFEIDDSKARWKMLQAVDEGKGRFGDWLAHPDLFDAYGDMASYPSRSSSDGSSFNPNTKEINVSISASRPTKTALHEGQHAIQDAEGFARGGSPLEFMGRQAEFDPMTDPKVKSVRGAFEAAKDAHLAAQEALKLHEKNQPRPSLFGGRASMAEYKARLDELSKSVASAAKLRSDFHRRFLDALERAKPPEDFSALHKYADLAGEVEARTVEKRAGLTPDQRRARAPWLDYDVPEAQQIVHGAKASFFPTATSSGTFFGRRIAAQMRRMAPASDQWRVRLQDKFLMVRRQQEEIERKSGSSLPLPVDVYVAESLFHGRAGERMADLQQKRVEPLVEHLRKHEIDADELGDYLYARHAQERNAYIRTIDPANDAGSGMTDADSQQILTRVSSGPKAAAFADAATMIDQINKETRSTLLSAGLITRETFDAWSNDYQHYVPLRGFEVNDEEQVFPRVGKGFNVRGPEAFQALGRRSKSDNPVAYVLLQAQQAIVRAEKNRVNKTLLRLVETHPDPDVWQVYRGEYKRVLKTDPATGQDYVDTVFVPPQFSAHDPSIVGVKVGGKQHYIQIHNPNLARALRGVGSSEFDHAIVRNMMALTRFYAQLLTSWNPEFVVGNFFRDVQAALLNSKDVADLPAGARKKMLTEALSLTSIRGIYNALRGDGSHPHAHYFEEFRQAGGKISFMEYSDVERIKSRINGLLTEGKTMRAIRRTAKYVEDVNTSVENGVRLSTYIAMREAGIAQDRAASVARELTVNFNRKGEWGPIINAAYMFFNASVQGSTRMLQAIAKSKAVRRAVYAIAFGGMAMEILNYIISGDDDDKENAYDKIKPWVKERNMIFMLPGRKDYLMIPMPYGYNVPYVAGQKIGELARSAAGHGKTTPAKAAAGIMDAMMGSFNPLGTSPTTSFLQMMSPTILDPVVQVAENKSWFGGPIYPTKFDRNKPDSENYFASVHPAFIGAAKFLNSTTGGNAAKSGIVDVSPEVLEHYATFLGGGVAKFLLNATGTGQRALSGEEFIPEKTPILRRLYGSQTSTSRRSEFYEAWTKVDGAHYEVIQLNKAGDREGMERARKENKAELEAYGAMRSTQQALSKYSKQRTQIQLNREMPESEKKTKLDDIKAKENEIILRAMAVYNRTQKQKGFGDDRKLRLSEEESEANKQQLGGLMKMLGKSGIDLTERQSSNVEDRRGDQVSDADLRDAEIESIYDLLRDDQRLEQQRTGRELQEASEITRGLPKIRN